MASVAAGGSRTRAIEESGTKCWGYNADGQTNVPPDLGVVVSVAVDGAHTCAIQESGQLRCCSDTDFNGNYEVKAMFLRTLVRWWVLRQVLSTPAPLKACAH